MAATYPRTVTFTSPSSTIRAVAAKRSAKLRIRYVRTRYVHFSKTPRRH